MARIERVWKTFSLLCEFSAFTFLVMFNINEVVDPSLPSSIRLTGVKLLRLMGWRGGRQIGPKHVAAASGKETAVDNFVFHCLLANVVFSEPEEFQGKVDVSTLGDEEDFDIEVPKTTPVCFLPL
jgi:hypothetical protein